MLSAPGNGRLVSRRDRREGRSVLNDHPDVPHRFGARDLGLILVETMVLRASSRKGSRCGPARTDHDETQFPKPHGKRREIAVGRDQNESFHVAGESEFHRVDHERDVGRVLAGDVVVLLTGTEAGTATKVRPRSEGGFGPVSENPPHGHVSVGGKLLEEVFDGRGRLIVAVDQNGETRRRR